jgi:hypothetical protein
VCDLVAPDVITFAQCGEHFKTMLLLVPSVQSTPVARCSAAVLASTAGGRDLLGPHCVPDDDRHPERVGRHRVTPVAGPTLVPQGPQLRRVLLDHKQDAQVGRCGG